MNRCQPLSKSAPQPELIEEPDVVLEWPSAECEADFHKFTLILPSLAFQDAPRGLLGYGEDWTASVPELIKSVAIQFAEKKQLELRANLLEIVLGELGSKIEKLGATRSIIVAINTFTPEPYELLKPILVSVRSVEDEFEAGWFDANIHTSGENEEEAVSNLKSLILDYFDSFSKEPKGKLGVEPTRQFAVIKAFVAKKD